MEIKSSYSYITGSKDEWKGFQERNAGIKWLGQNAREKTSDINNEQGVISSLVDIYSEGVRMQGTLWKPVKKTMQVLPAILMCHGWGGIRDHLDARFGKVFAKAGFVVLTFDYRTWNDSDGVYCQKLNLNSAQQKQAKSSDTDDGQGKQVSHLELHLCRQVVDMDWQIADIEAAFSFLLGESCVDPKRIGLWGISQGGGHVITLGSRLRGKIAAIVAQVPSCGNAGAGSPLSLEKEAEEDATARARGISPLSVVQGVSDHHLPGMDGVPNMQKLVRYRPLDTAHLITCPVLVVDVDQEEMFDRKLNGQRAFEIVQARNPQSKYMVLPGRHYDAYDGPAGQFRKGTSAAVDFFQKHLAAEDIQKSKI